MCISRVLLCRSSTVGVDEKRFLQASKDGNVIPLYKCIFSDHLTPVLAYRCLVKEDDREAPSFIFESVEPGFRSSTVVRNATTRLDFSLIWFGSGFSTFLSVFFYVLLLLFLIQGRYSVVGAQPAMEIVAKENVVTILDHSAGKVVKKLAEDPMAIPRAISEGWKPQLIQDLPDAFCGEDLVFIFLCIMMFWVHDFLSLLSDTFRPI